MASLYTHTVIFFLFLFLFFCFRIRNLKDVFTKTYIYLGKAYRLSRATGSIAGLAKADEYI
jgi:hypothetical protein